MCVLEEFLINKRRCWFVHTRKVFASVAHLNTIRLIGSDIPERFFRLDFGSKKGISYRADQLNEQLI